MTSKRQDIILILGESPMVEELSEACTRGGFAVRTRISGSSGSKRKTGSRRIVTAIELTNTDRARKEKNIRLLEQHCPQQTPILSSSITVTASRQTGWLASPGRLLGLAALPTLLSRPLLEVAPTPHTSRETILVVKTIMTRMGKEISVVQDRIGMVLPRILCMLINEASFAVMEEVAAAADIDRAMKLGTKYPFGPIEWGNQIGVRQVVSVLEALLEDLGEERYRVSPLLRQMAEGKQWWPT